MGAFLHLAHQHQVLGEFAKPHFDRESLLLNRQNVSFERIKSADLGGMASSQVSELPDYIRLVFKTHCINVESSCLEAARNLRLGALPEKFLLCATVFSVPLWCFSSAIINHRDTENTEWHREEVN